jgi:hypothetical protein
MKVARRSQCVLLLALLSLCACRAQVRPSIDADALPVSELSLDFPTNEEGQLAFSLDVPPSALGSTATQVTWELWLGALRFATGIEGPTPGVAQPDGRVRVTVTAPLVYRHVTWVEGSAHVQVGLRAEVQLSAPALSVVRFQGRRELLVRGKPVLDEADE